VTAPGSFSRSFFLLGFGYFISAFANASGQTTPSYSEMAQQADSQLNRTYQQVMQKLQPKARDQLRNSQRAWLGFVEQNTIALRSACAKLGWTEDDCNERIVGEVESRTAWLNGLVEPEDMSNLPKAKIEELLPRLDAELNVVYQRCLHAVPEEQATQLRQAQRAWLTCRDASRALGTKLVYYMLSHRIDQLNTFYLGPTKEAQVNWEEKADASVPDPFERGGR
jgi:uncharacterized protein YecT (DUF1311 family)